MNSGNLPGSLPRACPVMRTGSTTLEAEDWQHGPTVEAVVVLLLREAFCLAADHVRQGGRSAVATNDVVCALKVLAHPTCDFIDTLVAPTRAEHAAGSLGSQVLLQSFSWKIGLGKESCAIPQAERRHF